jgi:cytochrome d ubiquinol oxidase subunit II
VTTAASFRLLPVLAASFHQRTWGFVFPVLAIAALLGIKVFLRTHRDAMIFAASCAYLVGMLTSAAFSLYPYVLPATTNPYFGLTVSNAKAADYGLRIGLIWWTIGMALAISYTIFTYRNFAGKVSPADVSEDEFY